jgi:hypothetical protein
MVRVLKVDPVKALLPAGLARMRIDPNRVVVSGNGIKTLTRDTPSVFCVSVFDDLGQPVETFTMEDVQIQFTPAVEYTVSFVQNHVAEVTFVASREVTNALRITVSAGGQHALVKTYVLKTSLEGTYHSTVELSTGEFAAPQPTTASIGLGFVQDGSRFVVLYANPPTLTVYRSEDCVQEHTITTSEMNIALGSRMVITPEDTILVSTVKSCQAQELTLKGRHVNYIGWDAGACSQNPMVLCGSDALAIGCTNIDIGCQAQVSFFKRNGEFLGQLTVPALKNIVDLTFDDSASRLYLASAHGEVGYIPVKRVLEGRGNLLGHGSAVTVSVNPMLRCLTSCGPAQHAVITDDAVYMYNFQDPEHHVKTWTHGCSTGVNGIRAAACNNFFYILEQNRLVMFY